jgi:pimeloyl-ACP methyl ester carboxylesterase
MAGAIKRIVLVHGAAHGAWCWEAVVPLLEAKGYIVEALDLPGAGGDPTPADKVTLGSYTQRVTDVLNSRPEPALLVGHSMGGAPISTAAEEAPEKVARLVYLAAFLPIDGATLRTIREWATGAGSAPPGGPRETTAHAFVIKDPVERFYHLCAADAAERAAARLRPQPEGPFTEPLRLTDERWGGVPKTYIICERDMAMDPALQRYMCARTPDIRIRNLNTDHSPFYSDPEGLTALLDEEARAGGAR